MNIRVFCFLLLLAIGSYFYIGWLWRNGKRKESAVAGGLLVLCAVIGSLLIDGVDVPSPTVPLRAVFEPLAKAMFGQ